MHLTKQDINLYYGKQIKPVICSIPRFKFITIHGQGNPNEDLFKKDVSALYAMTYAVKMSYRQANPPIDYYAYTIFPLEGIWDLIDYTKPSTDKSNFKYTLMIQQPDFLTPSLFSTFYNQVMVKKSIKELEKVKFNEIEEGLVCQMLHVGSFDLEPASFAIMEHYVREKGYRRSSKLHREIYFSDPRRTDEANLRTLLRFQIEKI
jgi:hypothetical protein